MLDMLTLFTDASTGERMIVMDPLNSGHNTTAKVFRIQEVISKFKGSFDHLQETFQRRCSGSEFFEDESAGGYLTPLLR
jgi:hypothetical protein